MTDTFISQYIAQTDLELASITVLSTKARGGRYPTVPASPECLADLPSVFAVMYSNRLMFCAISPARTAVVSAHNDWYWKLNEGRAMSVEE